MNVAAAGGPAGTRPRPQSLLADVRARMRRAGHLALPTRRPVSHRDTGGHLSRQRERSLDFDDLREYVIGDDVGDIDWKATARAGHPLVKRYIAPRQTSVLVVADTGRELAALADATTAKWEVAVTAAAIAGDVAMRNGDTVGLVASGATQATERSTRDGVIHVPPRRGDAHLEGLLRTLRDAVEVEGSPSQLPCLLDFVATEVRRRSLVVVVAAGAPHAADQLVRLAARHDVLYCWIDDAIIGDPQLAGRRLRAVGSTGPLPGYFQPTRRPSRRREALHDDLRHLAAQRNEAGASTLSAMGIAGAPISAAGAITDVIRLLSMHRHYTTASRR